MVQCAKGQIVQRKIAAIGTQHGLTPGGNPILWKFLTTTRKRIVRNFGLMKTAKKRRDLLDKLKATGFCEEIWIRNSLQGIIEAGMKVLES